MAKTIPPYGEIYLGDNPWAVRADEIIMYYTGRNTSSVAPFGTDVDSDDVAVTATSDAQTVALWNLPQNTFVHHIYALTPDSWGADSDAANITIGDSGVAARYMDDTTLAPAATDDSGICRRDTAGGILYWDTGGQITATFPLTSSAVSTGLTKFILVYSMAK